MAAISMDRGLSVQRAIWANDEGHRFCVKKFIVMGREPSTLDSQIRTLFCWVKAHYLNPNLKIDQGDLLLQELAQCKNLKRIVFYGNTYAITRAALNKIVNSLPALTFLKVEPTMPSLEIENLYGNTFAARSAGEARTRYKAIGDLICEAVGSVLPRVLGDLVEEYRPVTLGDLLALKKVDKNPDPFGTRLHSNFVDLLRLHEECMEDSTESPPLYVRYIPDRGKDVYPAVRIILDMFFKDFLGRFDVEGLCKLGLKLEDAQRIGYPSMGIEAPAYKEWLRKLDAAWTPYRDALPVDEFVDIVKQRDYIWLLYQFANHLLSDPNFSAQKAGK